MDLDRQLVSVDFKSEKYNAVLFKDHAPVDILTLDGDILRMQYLTSKPQPKRTRKFKVVKAPQDPAEAKPHIAGVGGGLVPPDGWVFNHDCTQLLKKTKTEDTIPPK